MITQDERLYKIGEVCDELNRSGYMGFQSDNLRQIEKVLIDVFDIRTDEYLAKLYTQSDLDKLKTILRLRSQGLDYNAIRSRLIKMHNPQHEGNKAYEECALDIELIQEKGIVAGSNIEELKEFMTEIVSSSLQSTVVSELHDLRKDLMFLKIQNADLKASLEKQQEEHFRQLDSKLTKWREESSNRKKTWFKKMYK